MPLPTERREQHVSSLFPCWGAEGRCGHLTPELFQDIAALQSVPANPLRNIPLLREGGFQAAFRSPRGLLLHSAGTGGWDRQGFSPASSSQSSWPLQGQPSVRGHLGLPRELRAPGEEARWAHTDLPWLSQKEESRRVQRGSTTPWDAAATPMPIQGSAQTEQTAPHQLPCCGITDSPSTLLSPGDPRHRSPPCCHSGDPGEPSPHPAGPQPGSEGGTGRPQPRFLINRC